MIESLKQQTFKPHRICMWLDEEEYGSELEDVKQELIPLAKSGIEVSWVTGGIKAHNKYYWAMQKYPEAIIITVDDDLIYRRTVIKELVNSYRKFPYAVSALRTHKILLDDQGNLKPYPQWIMEQREILDIPSQCLFFTTGAGTLFPPHIIKEDAFDISTIKVLSLYNDDIWLNVRLMLDEIPLVATGMGAGLDYIPETQEDGLWQENVIRNDQIFAALFEAYPAAKENLINAIEQSS